MRLFGRDRGDRLTLLFRLAVVGGLLRIEDLWVFGCTVVRDDAIYVDYPVYFL